MPVTRISPVQFEQKTLTQKDKTQKQNITDNKTAGRAHQLETFMNALGSSNKSVVSFGYNPTKHGTKDKEYVPAIPMNISYVRPYGADFDVDVFSPTLSDYAKSKIYNEASSRINGTRPWPQIDGINGWMVSDETDEFKSDGGLGKVAADLPNSFNYKFREDKKNYMSVVTPMYVNGKAYRLGEKD